MKMANVDEPRRAYTDLPATDIFPTLPGTDRHIVRDRFLLRKTK